MHRLLVACCALLCGCAASVGPLGEVIEIFDEPAGTRCAAGGKVIKVGNDIDGDGRLFGGEVRKTHYVCNGEPGDAGAPGEQGVAGEPGASGASGDAGAPGASALVIDTTSTTPTAECPSGTRTLQLGVDDSGDGVLDAAEVDSVLTFCLSPGSDGGSVTGGGGGTDSGTGGGAGGGTGGGTDGGTDGGTGGGTDGGTGGGTGGGADGGTGGGTGGGADGGTGGGAAGGPDGGSGGGADGGTGGGTDGGTGGGTDAGTGVDAGTVPIGAFCQPGGTNTCSPGESCMLVEMGTNQFEPHCIMGGCDVVAQDCTGGLACGYAAVNNVVQRTCISPGTRQDGETCGPAVGSCAAGLTCTGSSSGEEICKKYCASDAQCSGGARCASLVIVPDSPERPLTCEPPVSACDVLLQDCPSASDACYLTSLGTLCQSAGTATPGQTCNATTLCEKGSTCVPALVGGSVTYQCVRLCGYPSGSPTCSAGTCQQLATQAGPILDGGVGACR